MIIADYFAIMIETIGRKGSRTYGRTTEAIAR